MYSSTEATAQIFWTAFQALSKKEKDAIVEKLLREKDSVEDLSDIVIFKQREKETARSLDEYLSNQS